MEPTHPKNQILDIAPDVFKAQSSAEALAKPIIPGFQESAGGIQPVYALRSLNFVSNGFGWAFGTNGDGQVNGNHTVSTNFTPTLKLKGVTIYVSNGTSPNGNLTAASGDVCLNADGGKLYVCVGGSSWYAPA